MSGRATATVLAFCALLATGIGPCSRGGGPSDGDLAVFHGTLRDDVKTLDPAIAYDEMSWEVLPSVYEQLYQYAYLSETFKVVPLLAADLPKVSADRLTLTIRLRKDVRYQDDPCFKETQGKGRELKAQDVIYGFKRLALPSLQSGGWWLLDGKVAGINAFKEKLDKAPKGDIPKVFTEEVEGLKALDDHTLQIKLVRPYPQLTYALTMPFLSPVPPEAVAAYADENGHLTDHAVGTGPFVVKSWERQRRLVLDRNPNYHPDFFPTEGSMEYRKRGLLADAGKPLPFVDRIVWDVIRETQPMWLEFMSGHQDLVQIPKDNFSQALTPEGTLTRELAAKGMRLVMDTNLQYFYLGFNMKDKVVGGNKALRQALSSTVDREKWIETFTNGTGRKQTTALPPGIPDRPSGTRLKYDFDLSRAKELMKKAGYPEGKGLPTLNMDMRGADSVTRQMGEFFTAQFAAVGVRLNVVYNTFPAFLEKIKNANFQLEYGGWIMDYPDAENVYQLLYGPNKAPGPNESSYDNPELNQLYEQMAVMDSGPKRAALVARMDAILQEDVPWGLGYYHTRHYLAQPWLLNFRVSDVILNKWKYVRVNRDVKRRYAERQ
jgi:oligopeptide transport system substrate-binding protein